MKRVCCEDPAAGGPAAGMPAELPGGGERPLVIVGIGAAAGASDPLIRFFSAMPPGHGIAFVLVEHLPADIERPTIEILRANTAFEVVESDQSIPVQADRIHVIPPRRHLSISGGWLSLHEPILCDGLWLPIDHFFCALAVDQGNRACGILFSGTGSDGALGLSEIRAAGGTTMVEDPAEAMVAPLLDLVHRLVASGRSEPAGAAPELRPATALPPGRHGGEGDARLLADELRITREELQSTIDQLKAANEELETSKEEFQTLNDEVNSVNAHLREKVRDLERARSDVVNLLSSTDIAAVFLDRELKVKRFTPTIVRLFSLIPSDLGRPIGDVVRRFSDLALLDDARCVLAELAPIAREVPGDDGRWYIRRITPYRTEDDRIEGVVVTLVDIAELEQTECARRESEEWLRAVLEQAAVGIEQLGLDGRVISTNPMMTKILGYSAEELLAFTFESITHPDDLPGEREQIARLMTGELPSFTLEKRYLRRDGREVWVRVTSSLTRDSGGRPTSRVSVIEDITDARRDRLERETAVDFLRLVNHSAGTRELVREALLFFQRRSGCEAVGIRLKDGDDFPYFEARGFAPEFLEAENRLCARDPTGQLVRDAGGDPLIECMCGNVIRGRWDPSKPFFTAAGSFWTNSTSKLLATSTEAERLARTRNRCHGEGFESVALIPLRAGGGRLGLLQLNDSRMGMFTAETIASWERLADSLAVALERALAKDQLRQRGQELEAARSEADTGKRRLEAVLAALPIGVAITDRAGGTLLANRAYEQVWGGPRPETRSVADYSAYQAWWADSGEPLAPEDWASARAIQTGLPVVGQFLRIRRFDGSDAWVLNSAAPIQDGGGRMSGSAVAILDVSALQRAEAALREAHARAAWLARFPEENPNPVVRSSAGGRALYCNPAARNLPGWGCEIDEPLPAPLPALVRRALEAGAALEQDIEIGGRLFAVGAAPTAGEVYVNLYGRDVTARQQAEEALRATARELARSNRDLEQFAYVASHDLQEPLRMVGSFVQLLGDRYRACLDDSAVRFIDFAVEGVVRMQQLIDDLLAYSRVGRGAAPAPVDSSASLERALGLLRASLEEAGGRVVSERLPEVRADGAEIAQLFQNLISNSIKFRDRTRPIEIQVGARREGGHWLFWVRDNGIGFDQAYAERVFVIFQRLHTRDAYPGTGMGLAICKKIVERHGGRIWVESLPGAGTTFYFTLSALSEEGLP